MPFHVFVLQLASGIAAASLLRWGVRSSAISLQSAIVTGVVGGGTAGQLFNHIALTNPSSMTTADTIFAATAAAVGAALITALLPTLRSKLSRS